MAKLKKFWIETDLADVENHTPTAIRIDWDNDRHQRIEIEGKNPIQVINSLVNMAALLKEELYHDEI